MPATREGEPSVISVAEPRALFDLDGDATVTMPWALYESPGLAGFRASVGYVGPQFSGLCLDEDELTIHLHWLHARWVVHVLQRALPELAVIDERDYELLMDDDLPWRSA
jgi:hypothetical protein